METALNSLHKLTLESTTFNQDKHDPILSHLRDLVQKIELKISHIEGSKKDWYNYPALKNHIRSSLLFTGPFFTISPMLEETLGIYLASPIVSYTILGICFMIFFLSYWPALFAVVQHYKNKSPKLMTLLGIAIALFYLYSTASVFGLFLLATNHVGYVQTTFSSSNSEAVK